MEVLEIAKGKDLFINEQIRAKEVLVIGPNGEQLGVKSRSDALTLASAAGFDLVQMGGKPEQPVCKLMDYNKYKYEKQKQKRMQTKHRFRKMLQERLMKQGPKVLLYKGAYCRLRFLHSMNPLLSLSLCRTINKQ